jgi:DNA-binding response OmpR family regulator
MKICFIDTDPEVFVSAKKVIDEQMVNVITVRCSSEEYLADLAESYQLVILDVDSPNEIDMGVLKNIMAKLELPIIVLSEIGLGANRLIRALQLGTTDYIFKPIEDSRLISAIDNHSKVRHTR